MVTKRRALAARPALAAVVMSGSIEQNAATGDTTGGRRDDGGRHETRRLSRAGRRRDRHTDNKVADARPNSDSLAAWRVRSLPSLYSG